MEPRVILAVIMKAMGIYTIIWGSIDALINMIANALNEFSKSSDNGFWLISFGLYSIVGYLLIFKSKIISDYLIEIRNSENNPDLKDTETK